MLPNGIPVDVSRPMFFSQTFKCFIINISVCLIIRCVVVVSHHDDSKNCTYIITALHFETKIWRCYNIYRNSINNIASQTELLIFRWNKPIEKQTRKPSIRLGLMPLNSSYSFIFVYVGCHFHLMPVHILCPLCCYYHVWNLSHRPKIKSSCIDDKHIVAYTKRSYEWLSLVKSVLL